MLRDGFSGKLNAFSLVEVLLVLGIGLLLLSLVGWRWILGRSGASEEIACQWMISRIALVSKLAEVEGKPVRLTIFAEPQDREGYMKRIGILVLGPDGWTPWESTAMIPGKVRVVPPDWDSGGREVSRIDGPEAMPGPRSEGRDRCWFLEFGRTGRMEGTRRIVLARAHPPKALGNDYEFGANGAFTRLSILPEGTAIFDGSE